MYIECINFNRWFKEAPTNDKYTYYIGCHLTDTILSLEMKKLTWKHACEGYIYLVQEKLAAFSFRYVAIKASKPPNERLLPFESAYRDKYRPYHEPKMKREIEPVDGQHG